jgi:hypothetical protein
MQTTFSSNVLVFAAAAPLVLALAGCSSDNNPATTDGGSSTTVTTTNTATGTATTSGSTSTSSGSVITDAGGGGDAGDATTGPLSLAATVYPNVLSQCTGCHAIQSDGGIGVGLMNGKLDMGDAAAAFEGLVGDGGGVLAQGTACGPLGVDAGLKRVVPGDPVHSLLWNKLASNDGGGGSNVLTDGGLEVACGVPMPAFHAALPATQIKTVSDWIEGGAKP